ncbi:MAG: ATP-binding protein [Kofleriaceae bacterium]|nr:ATP-binding protein [Kofleriaceae bacterium]
MLPLALPGDDLERIVVGLGGMPLATSERTITALFGAGGARRRPGARPARRRALVARTGGSRAGLDTARIMLRPGGLDLIATDVVRGAEALAGARPPAGLGHRVGGAAAGVAGRRRPGPDVGGRRTLRVTGDRSTHAAVGGPGRGLDVGEVRPAELAHLEARARACFETRTPVFVDVRGPAGAGKSRLREAVMAHVAERREVDWLVARAAPLGEAAPLSLLRAADPAWLDAALRPGLTDRAATLAAARRWIEGRARRRPVVIVVEDLQWADEMSRAVLGHLVSHLDAVPVLVLGFTATSRRRAPADAAAPAAPPAPARVES